MLGFLLPFSKTPSVTVANAKVVEVYGEEKAKDLVETTTSLIVLFWSFGNVIAYYASPFLTDVFSYRRSFEILAGFIFICSGLYLVFGGGYKTFKK